MQIALPELNAPVTLLLDREHPLSDDACFAFCTRTLTSNACREGK
jgi:hypothetical protein